MKSRLFFYGFILALTIVDAYLISNPNLLGKLGFIIYKLSYLRTFPKALGTVSVVVGVSILITEALSLLIKRQLPGKKMSYIFLVIILFLIAVLVKTELDFQSWSYHHVGSKLRYGAYLLPVILILITLDGYSRALRHKATPLKDTSKN
jgi:hypothetical protein